MNSFTKGILIFISVLLSINVILNVEERIERVTVKAEVKKSISELEVKRAAIFQSYQSALSSYETKSVWHQIYHSSNAQLMMLTVLAQENELLLSLVSGKK